MAAASADESNDGLAMGNLDLDPLPPPPTDDAADLGTVSSIQPVDQPRLAAFRDYELLHEIARGGMGVVYKARQRSLDRIVAVKMIRDGALAGPEDVARFRTEAAAAARLRHPNIVAIHEVGAEQDQYFFSMDFINGTSLAEHAREHPLSTAAAATLVRTIAEAVQAAHDHGILHRDLKPSNVLLDRFGQPHVTDFGLAKRLDGGAELTGTDQVLGTPSYMPPEQALGQHGRGGFASDVYSLGAMLYELLTGRPPFRGETAMGTIRQVLETEPVSPRRLNMSVSRDLETICLKCLEKDPQRRYARAQDLADELARAIGGEPIQARPLGRVARGWRWCRRHPARAVIALLVVTLAVGGPTAALRTTELLRMAQIAENRRVSAQVLALRTAAPEAVDSIVDDLRRDWDAVEPQLTALWGDPSLSDHERSRLSAALLKKGRPYCDYAYERLLAAEAREFDMLRQALASYRGTLTHKLWNELASRDPSMNVGKPGPWMNAAAALAAYDPGNKRWPQHADRIAQHLVRQDALTAAAWAGYFDSVKLHLIPHLCKTYRSPDETLAAQRALATDLLGRYAADDAELLVELFATADARQFRILFPPLEAYADAARETLTRELNRLLGMQPTASDDPRDIAAANLAIALFQMKAPEYVWSLLRHSPDPTVRTFLIHRLLPFGADATRLADRLDTDDDVSVHRAILLALGEGDPSLISPRLRERLIDRLESLFRDSSDTGIHAAAEWTLRRWGQDDLVRSARAASLDRDPHSMRGRFIISEGQVMTVVRGPVEFQSGGKTIRIERSFAFALKELTREQYLRFQNDPQIRATLAAEQDSKKQPGRHWYNESWAQSFGPDPQCPHLSIPWTVAIRYCRWLGEQEGLPEDEQCFVPGPTTDDAIELKANYLDRTGYRMPTAAEWEYMCRAGADTERFFGRSEAVLSEYAWYVPNSQQRTWPVGTLKPNDLGVFDIHGNIREWCLNSSAYLSWMNPGGIALDEEDVDHLIDPLQRMPTRGGCYNDQSRFIRSAARDSGHGATVGNNLNGLRLVRTLRLGEPSSL